MKVILASKSPRRKELLSLITKDFEVIVSHADEKVEEDLSPEEKVKAIATQKAKDVFDMIKQDKNLQNEDFVVIGCDTIVVLDEVIYGKPKDREDAIRMLKLFSDNTHEVMSGLCMIFYENGKVSQKIGCDISKVHVKQLSDEEIEAWLDTGNAWDKAGAYAIQQEFAVHIDKIEGNFVSVMGLPVYLVYDFMKERKVNKNIKYSHSII